MIVIPYDRLIENSWFMEWLEDQMSSRIYSVFFEHSMTLKWQYDEQGRTVPDSYYQLDKSAVNRKLKRLWRFLPKNWRAICTEKGVFILVNEPMSFWMLKQNKYVKELMDECWELETSNDHQRNQTR